MRNSKTETPTPRPKSEGHKKLNEQLSEEQRLEKAKARIKHKIDAQSRSYREAA